MRVYPPSVVFLTEFQASQWDSGCGVIRGTTSPTFSALAYVSAARAVFTAGRVVRVAFAGWTALTRVACLGATDWPRGRRRQRRGGGLRFTHRFGYINGPATASAEHCSSPVDEDRDGLHGSISEVPVSVGILSDTLFFISRGLVTNQQQTLEVLSP